MRTEIRKINENDYEKIFVMTDLHGHYDLFLKMIDKISFSKEDLLIITGDSCDRGSFSYELYNWYIEKENEGYRIIHLMGNHEDMLYRSRENPYKYRKNWLWNGGNQTILSFFNNQDKIKDFDEYINEDKIFEEKWLFDFIEKMPYILEGQNYMFVHAGIDFSKLPEEQEKRYLLWTRDDWYEKNNTGKTVFYGHTPQKEITVRNNCVNLDRGIYSSKILNCAELKQGELYTLENGEIKKEKFFIENGSSDNLYIKKENKKENKLLEYLKKFFFGRTPDNGKKT